MNTKILPVGVAIHTRGIKRGEDYGWYVAVGETTLFDKMAEVHRIVLRDVNGDTPQLAVIVTQQCIGFLISNMPSPRSDHAPRIINDTLYLEFNQDHFTVLKAAATLLICSQNDYKEYEHYFTEYAEILYQKSLEASLSLEDLEEIKYSIAENLVALTRDKLAVALPYDENSSKQCAGYLIAIANSEVNSFCFVSTGRVSLEKCQQVAGMSEECVVLTQSSEIEQEIELKEKHTKLQLLSKQFFNQVRNTFLKK